MSETIGGPAGSAPQPMQPMPGGPPRPGAGPVPPVLAALARAQQGGGPGATSPGAGAQANSLMQIKQAIDMLQTALPGLGTGGEAHGAVLTAIRALSRHVPQGEPTAGVQQTQLQDMLRQTVRNALLQRVMAQQGGAASPMNPSTPMPGA